MRELDQPCNMSGSLDGPMKQEPPVFRSGALRDAPSRVYQLGGFPPKGAPLTGCQNNGPKSVTATRGIETALVSLAVLRRLFVGCMIANCCDLSFLNRSPPISLSRFGGIASERNHPMPDTVAWHYLNE